MNKLQVLTALRDNLRVGDVNTGPSLIMMRSAFPHHDKIAWKAYNGSLDAAKALHEAVLTGYDYEIVSRGNRRTVHVYAKPLDAFASTGVSVESTARAWLLAILEALIAQEEQGD